jgi:hypothetical protein
VAHVDQRNDPGERNPTPVDNRSLTQRSSAAVDA